MNSTPRLRKSRAPRRGFTLVETIAAIVVIGTIGSVSSGLIYSAVNSYRSASTIAQVHNDCSAALDRLSKSLWSIPRDTAASVVAPKITSVTATSIAWGTNSTLQLVGNKLNLLDAGGSESPILEHVSAFTLSCFNESNAALPASMSGAATEAIRRIQLTVTVTREGVSQTLRTRVFIRSTMSGAAVG